MQKGKQLELFVAQVEKLLLPAGFEVRANEKIVNDEGVQIAEFDLEIAGKVGSASITWLIECRDRPASGPAPGSWIEQLVGRCQRFGFNKVTAVSTTGFSPSATEYAKKTGIDLRVVSNLSPNDIIEWFPLTHFKIFNKKARLEAYDFSLYEETSENIEILQRFMKENPKDGKFLISSETGKVCTVGEAFLAVVSNNKCFDFAEHDKGEKKVRIRAEYPDDNSHFVLDVGTNRLRLKTIYFVGTVLVDVTDVPINSIMKYASDQNEMISQSVVFSPPEAEFPYDVEFHKLETTGETHILLRKK
jgi:hypothetical protein